MSAVFFSQHVKMLRKFDLSERTVLVINGMRVSSFVRIRVVGDHHGDFEFIEARLR